MGHFCVTRPVSTHLDITVLGLVPQKVSIGLEKYVETLNTYYVTTLSLVDTTFIH